MTQKYQVKVSMKQAAIVETGIVLKQGDFGMQLEIEVLDFDVTGTTPQIVFRKAMGAVESTTITVSGNKYTYTFVGTELDTPGKCFCDLKLKNSTMQRISTASFMFRVVADTLDGLAEESSSYSDTIAQIVESLNDYSIESEAWASGTKEGIPVTSTDPQYKNNAKYYSEKASTTTEEKTQNLAVLTDVKGETFVGCQVESIQNGVIHVTGTSTAAGIKKITGKITVSPGTYSFGTRTNGSPKVYLQIRKYEDNTGIAQTSTLISQTFEETTNIYIRIMVEASKTYDAYIKPELVQNDVYSPDFIPAEVAYDAIARMMASRIMNYKLIQSNDDLDNYLTSGYRVIAGGATVAHDGFDVDSNRKILLIFKEDKEGGTVYQFEMITDSTYAIKYRVRSNATIGWSEWAEIYSKDLFPSFSISFLNRALESNDFDTALDPGWYLTAYGTSYQNDPIGTSHDRFLLTVSAPSSSYKIQLAFCIDAPQIWIRIKKGSPATWNTWNKIADYSESVKLQTSISSGDDLNNLTEAGYYYLFPGANLLNCPIATAKRRGLEVFKIKNDQHIAQRCFSFGDEDPQTFVRVRTGNSTQGYTWFEWEKESTNENDLKSTLTPQIDNRIFLNQIASHKTKGTASINNFMRHVLWESGGLGQADGQEWATPNYARSEYIPISDGDSFLVIYPTNPEYFVRFFFYDSSKNFLYRDFSINSFSEHNKDYAVAAPKGFMRLVIYKGEPNTEPIDPSEARSVDFVLRRLSFNNALGLTVGTHNVRNYGTEYSYGYTGDFETNFNDYVNLYGSMHMDILGMQEFSPMLDAAYNHPAEELLSKFFNNLYQPGTWLGIPIASIMPVSDMTFRRLSSGRGACTAKITLEDNTVINLINCHTTPGSDQETIAIRQEEYEELISWVQAFDSNYSIITGDFNALTIGEFDVFKEAGFHVANGGDFGTFLTCYSNSSDTWYPCDNIITTSNIIIDDIKMAESRGTSDHKLLVAKLHKYKW